MKFITSSKINVNVVIPHGKATSYQKKTTSLWVKKDSYSKRYNADEITNATTTSTGSLKFNDVTFPDTGVYSLKVVYETNADLDTDAVTVYDTIFTDTVYKVEPVTEIIIK